MFEVVFLIGSLKSLFVFFELLKQIQGSVPFVPNVKGLKTSIPGRAGEGG